MIGAPSLNPPLMKCAQQVAGPETIPVADPGFPRGGCANCKGGGAILLFLPIFPQKLHEIKEIWTERGGRVPGAPLDPPMKTRNGFTGMSGGEGSPPAGFTTGLKRWLNVSLTLISHDNLTYTLSVSNPTNMKR